MLQKGAGFANTAGPVEESDQFMEVNGVEVIKLSDEERYRFTAYCKQEAEQCEMLAKKMGKLPPLLAKMSQRERNKAAAFAIVGSEINPDNWERQG